MRAHVTLLSAALVLASCASEPALETSPQGPPSINAAAIENHGEQFDEDVPVRTPGSEEELAASSYILGHLQQAGYVPLLESVPVGDLVESTNVVAMPQEISDTSTVVTVSYGTPVQGAGGLAIGAFLELARALKASDPEHRVGFVALGAEGSERFGGTLGSRRLIQYLDDQGLTPDVITLEASGDPLSASGPLAEDVVDAAGQGEVVDPPRDDVYARARLSHTTVSGPPAEVAGALLELLHD